MAGGPGRDAVVSTALIPVTDDAGELKKDSIVAIQAESVFQKYQVISFNNRAMYLVDEPFEHYIPLTKERFDRIAYNLLPGPTRSRVSDVYALVCNRADDLSDSNHLILFGQRDSTTNPDERAIVWDSRALSPIAYEPDRCVWRSPYPQLKPSRTDEPMEFVMQLAGGDEGVYDDIMQAIAPMIMDKKPDGAIWFVGDGANGKSTLMDALYRIFPGQLASLTVKSLTDGRDTPMLNGQLANIVKESSEGRIDDTEIYKAIGTHEDFSVHKFHSQDPLTIKGNMHHIFSANLIPAFNDKGFSARRRTFIIPFNERFVSDPSFEERTFTPEFFSQLIGEMCKYAVRIRDQGYKYKWSAKTLGAKADYDTEANNAEEYAGELIAQGVVAFDSFQPVKMDYENWCAENGYVPLGIGNMRRALQAAGFLRSSRFAAAGKTASIYRIVSVNTKDLQPYGMGRIGMYTVEGFEPTSKPTLPLEEDEELTNIVRGW